MDANFINNDDVSRSSTSLTGIDHRPGTFDARGVFQLDDASSAFWCQVCNKPIKNLEMIPMHIVGKRHCLKLDEARASYDEKADGHFACKLCTNFVSPDWRGYLRHFEEKQHFQELSNAKQAVSDKDSQNPNVLFSYNTLIMNQVIEHKFETYFCCCCKQLVIGQNLILQHISEKCHKELQRTSHNNKDAVHYREDESARFVKNFIFHVDFSLFNCNLCDRTINGKKNCWQHIRGTEHIQNFIIKEDPNYKSLVEFPSSKLPLDEISESSAKLMWDNSITGPSNTGEYHCKLCGCMLSGQKPIGDHLAGKRHKQSIESGGNVLQVSGKSVTQIEETSTGSLRGWKPIGNPTIIKEDSKYKSLVQFPSPELPQDEISESSAKLMRDNSITGPSKTGAYHCKLCGCMLATQKNIVEHLSGQRHKKSLESGGNVLQISGKSVTKIQETSTGSSRGWEPIENPTIIKEDAKYKSLVQFPSPELPQDEISESSAKLMRDNSITGPSKTGEYHCKLCRCMLSDQNTIAEHLSGKRHKKSMESRGNVLQVSGKSVTKIEETSTSSSSSWKSTDNSSRSWETYEDESQSSGSYENSSYSREFSNNVTDSWETISILGSSSDSQGSKSFKISSKLMPLISKHGLHHLEREIFCSLCNAHLRSEQCLINHIRCKYHIAELNRHKDQITNRNTKQSTSSQNKNAANSPTTAIKEASQPGKNYGLGNGKLNDEAKKVESQYSTLFEKCENLIPLISEHMLQYGKQEIFCLVCQVRLQSPQSLVEHIKSKNHVMRLNTYKARRAKESKESTDTSERNSSSGSFSDTICKNKSPNPINTENEVSTVTQKTLTQEPQLSQSGLFRLPNYLIPMLAPHSLQQLRRSVFCQACQLHMKHVNTLLEHMTGKNHAAGLSSYKAKILNEIDSSQSTSIRRSNSAINSPMNVVMENPSNVKSQNNGAIPKPATSNTQNSQSILMDIPKKLLPLITKHSLKHLTYEIYCVACQVHMTNESSLVSHTSSHRHTARLKSFQANTLSKNKNIGPVISSKLNVGDACKELKLMKQNLNKSTNKSENGTGLGHALSKLTITEKKGENSRNTTQNRSRNFMARTSKNQMSRRQDTRPKQSRPFDPKYLQANMDHIYEVNPEQLRILKLSCRLCFPKSSNSVYCLICENTVSSHLQTFYEHIWGKAHTTYLAEAEQNNRYFMNYPEQFSDLTLAKEFMQESQEETIQCFACDESLKNEDVVIYEHIRTDLHSDRKQLWNKKMEKILQDILTETKSTWYNIQKYWCVFCDVEYNTEFQFAEHIDGKKHDNCVKKIGAFQNRLVYDSCISCATLWLGLLGTYAQHCEQPMHKYLVGTGDFSVCKLPNQAKTLLENAVPEVDSLIELSDQVSTVQKVKTDALLKCLENTVKPVFPNVKAYPFGSRVSGLGFPDSDIDVFLDCGTYDGNKTTRGYQEQLIIAVEGCLYRNQISWEVEETLVSSRTPIIKLRHRDTELRCDVSFKNGLSVENTKLLKYFIDNYPLCRKLMLFLKKWLASCNLSGSHYITNYANCWYVIFYLQSKSILPSVASLIAKENKSKLIDGWETGISARFHVDQQEFTFTELLHGFFEFYSKFDFRDFVACPLLGRAVPKQDFTELDLLPKEMAPYVKHVTMKSIDGSAELFRIDSEMCVQDPFDLSHNLTKGVRKFTLNRFRRLCATSAEVLNNFIQH